MALRNLSNAQMLLLTRLALGDLRPSLEGNPGLLPVLRALEALLPELLKLQPPATDPEGADLAAEGKAADAVHDRLLRALFMLLEAHEALAEGDRTADIARTRIRLFPDGLRMIQRAYAEEAAEGVLAPGRLDDADHALLRSIPVAGDRTAHDVYTAWTRACGELEQVERKRLAAPDDAVEDEVRQFDVRRKWMRAMNGFEAIADLADAADHPLLAALRTYEQKADERVAGRSANATTEPATPAEPPVEPLPQP
jgi:hypothetical protein